MYELSIPSMLYMYGSRCFSQGDPRWSYMQCGIMLWLLLTSFFALSLFVKSLFFFCMATLAQCTNQDSNCIYAGTNLWHKGWYDDTNMILYVCNGWYRSLMCTSNVAGNTQMASLDRQVTQNGLGVINAIATEYTMEGYHDTKMMLPVLLPVWCQNGGTNTKS